MNRRLSIRQLLHLKCVLLLSVVLVGSSCKTKKMLNKGKCLLDFKNARTLASNLKANEFKFERLNAKLSADAEVDSTSASFTVTLRMRRDSVIWMSVSKLGIEGARVLITKDSVKFVNRIKNTYFAGDFSYLSKLANTELDFEILQSILIGNSVEFYDEDEKLKPGISECQYILGTTRKKKMKRVMEKGKELREPAQSIYMVPETFKISRILFYEFNPDRSFDAVYSNYEPQGGDQLFPMKMNYTIKANKIVKVDIAYNKVVLNEEQSFPFKIPDNYERIIIKEKK